MAEPALRARPIVGAAIRLYENRFTARGKFLFWAICAFALIGVDTRRSQVFVLFAVAFAVLAVASVYVSFRRPRLAIAGRLPARLTAGRPLAVPLRVTSDTQRRQEDVVVSWPASMELGPAPAAVPREAYLATAPGLATDVSLELHAPRRGRFAVSGPAARVTDPLRLVTSPGVRIPDETLTVYPRYFRIDELEVPLGRRYQPGGIPLTSSTGDSIEFVGTRDYREGDPLRHIHWRSWARRGVPVVKEYQEEYFCRIALILDTFLPRRRRAAEPEAFEASVSLLASVADFFSRSEYIVDILAAGPDLYEVSAGRSLGYLDNVLDVLANIEPCYDPPFERIGPPLFARLARLTTVVAVLQDWDEGRREFLHRVQSQGTSVRGFVVREGPSTEPLPDDHALGEISALKPSEVESALETGGSMRFLSELPGAGAVRG
jgi:uncharacterized protein (DUF58 family)